MQKAHFAIRACKQPGFIQRGIWPTVQIYRSSGLRFVMVPGLNQCNVYIKRKLRECRAQKCNPCFGAKSPLRNTSLQTTRFHAASYRADSTNLWKFEATFHNGTVLHQCNVYIKRKLRERRAQKCNPCFGAKSQLRNTSLHTTRFHSAGCRADSTNLREFGATFHHGTVFAPMQCLYQKEAKGM